MSHALPRRAGVRVPAWVQPLCRRLITTITGLSTDQTRLPFHREAPGPALEVLDLFAGIGGLSLGFRNAGFDVVGVDLEDLSGEVFRENRIGRHIAKNLYTETEVRDVPVVVGGPPCRPWSSVNLQRRGSEHDDHGLLERFFVHLWEIRPAVFIMENVPPLARDPEYERLIREMRWRGYSVTAAVLRYAHFGAATTRRRLFTVGFRDSVRWSADEFFRRMEKKRRPHRTVRQEIGWLRDQPRNAVPDHVWSQVRTIARYADRYRTGKYGWKQLGWDDPAPSFGSVGKTYILHPAAGEGDFPVRVLSVREVLSIMGFDRSFRFPDGAGLHKRYRMAANSVSPIVAETCARVIREMLTDETDSRCDDGSCGPEATANPSTHMSEAEDDAEA